MHKKRPCIPEGIQGRVYHYSLVFYFLLTYILLNYFYNGKHRKLYLGLAIGFSSLIMLSRLVLGVHFFTDILAGVINATILISNYLYFSKQINLVIKQ